MTKQISKLAQQAIDCLRTDGVKFNIVTPVGHRIELFYSYRNEITGKPSAHFVAEITDLGNIEAFGPYVDAGVGRDFVLNADGERV